WTSAFGVDHQVGDPLEVAEVSRDQRQLVGQCRRGDQQVRVLNGETLAPELPTDARETLHDGARKGEHLDAPKEPQEVRFLSAWIIVGVDAVVDLTVGDQADGQTFMTKRGKQLDRIWST